MGKMKILSNVLLNVNPTLVIKEQEKEEFKGFSIKVTARVGLNSLACKMV